MLQIINTHMSIYYAFKDKLLRLFNKIWHGVTLNVDGYRLLFTTITNVHAGRVTFKTSINVNSTTSTYYTLRF